MQFHFCAHDNNLLLSCLQMVHKRQEGRRRLQDGDGYPQRDARLPRRYRQVRGVQRRRQERGDQNARCYL